MAYDAAMPIPTAMVGSTTGPLVHEVDARWTMAYAASIGDTSPRYLDTAADDGPIAHPVFPVCVEWPVIVAARNAYEDVGVSAAEVRTGVHATHDLTIHRPIRPGDRLATSLETVGAVGITPGALVTSRLTTVGPAGEPVATTTQDGIHLGVPADGPDRPDLAPPPPLPDVDRTGRPVERTIEVDGGRAHIYTECARIWNPIHTDPVVARRAGLPDIILHGTANLAYGVTAALAVVGADPDRVRRIRCRFRAMVRLPSTLTVRVWGPPGDEDGRTAAVAFEVLNAAGQPAVEDGILLLDTDTSTDAGWDDVDG